MAKIKKEYDYIDRIQATYQINSEERPTTEELKKLYSNVPGKTTVGPVQIITASELEDAGVDCSDYAHRWASFRVDTGDKGDLAEGEILFLSVDLTRPESEIISGVKEQVRYYKQFVPEQVQTRKPTKLDPWEVYRMHDDGRNFTDIARKLSGLKGSPAHNPELKAYRKKVLSAYERAAALIARDKELKK